MLSTLGIAAEVDDFTSRAIPLRDSTAQVNAYINLQIEAALKNPTLYEESNYVVISGGLVHMGYTEKKKINECNKPKLLNLLEYALNTNWPEVRTKLLRDSTVTNNGIRRPAGTIYEGTSAGPLMRIGGCCDPVISVSGKRVGIDKVDHFLGHGYMYYSKVAKTGKVSDAIQLGLDHERGSWGLAGTGVKSYADLSANYQGYLFWKKLVDGPDALIQCVNNKYVLAHKADISHFVSDAWDETNNCSSYSTETDANKIESRIKKLTGGKLCPLEPEKCAALKAHYGSLAKDLLHPQCLDPKNHVNIEEGRSFWSSVWEAF